MKFLQGVRMQGFSSGQSHRLWIPVDAVHEVLIVQVRTGGEPCHSYIADHVALLHARAYTNGSCEARHVAVERRYVAAMGEQHCIAIPAAPPCKTDMAVACRMHRGTGWRRVVGTHVAANGIQDWMHAVRIERRTDAREVERRAQERLAHCRAARRVIAGA